MFLKMLENLTILTALDTNITTFGFMIIAVSVFWLWWRKPHQRFPSGPRGVPLFGVLPWIGKYPERVLKKWSRKYYGPVMSARFGMEDVVVLNTFEAIQQALVKQGSDFSGRPDIKLYTQILGKDGILFADYDKKFKTQKKFMVNVLKKFGQGKREMEKIINEESDYFVDFLKTIVGRPYHVGNDFQNLIGNVICRVIFGRRFEYDDPSFRKVFDVLKNTYSDPKDASSIAALLFFYDYVKNFPPFSAVNQKIIQSEVDMLGGILPVIEEHKKSFDESHIRDYIDAFIYEQKFGKDSGFSDSQLLIAVRDLFAAGTETSSSTVGWIILALLHHPEYQAKIVEEVDRAFGENESPSMAKRNQMPFTCAFIQEVQRYCTVVPLSVTHIAQNNVEIAGYHIPKGTKVIPNIWGAHFDPKTWKDPFKFDPYRHINSDDQYVPSSKIIPFGIGPRFCPGESIARMELFLVLTKVLQKFNITATGEPLPGLLSGMTTIVHTAGHYEVIFNPR